MAVRLQVASIKTGTVLEYHVHRQPKRKGHDCGREVLEVVEGGGGLKGGGGWRGPPSFQYFHHEL